MRFFEIVLLTLLLLPLVWPLTGWKRPFWLDWLSLAAVLVIVPHLIWEGARWQMGPAYLLAGLLAASVVWRRLRL